MNLVDLFEGQFLVSIRRTFKILRISNFKTLNNAALTALCLFQISAIVTISSSFAILQSLHFSFSSPLALLVGILGSIWISYKTRRIAFSVLALSSIVTLLAASVTVLFKDTSWDGLPYHSDAIINFSREFSLQHTSTISSPWALWITSYPKMSWLFGGALFALTKSLQMATIVNVLALVSLFSLSLAVFHKHSNAVKLFAVFAFCGNPIIITQIFTHYVDGLLATFLSIIVLVFIGFYRNSLDHGACLKIFLVSAIAISALKFNGVIDSLLFALLGIVTLFKMDKKSRSKFFIGIRRRGNFFQLSYLALTGFSLFYNPYITNILGGKNPFFPLLGHGSIPNLISGQTTEEFNAQPLPVQVLRSIFSKGENLYPSAKPSLPQLKIPLTTSWNELFQFRSADIRIGGWGPMFSGMFCLALIMLVVLLTRVPGKLELVALVVPLAIIGFLLPGDWWARYNPSLYLFVVILILLGIENIPLPFTLSWILVGLVFLNGSLVMHQTVLGTRETTKATSRQVGEFLKLGLSYYYYGAGYFHLDSFMPAGEKKYRILPQIPPFPIAGLICYEVANPPTKLCGVR